MNSFNTRSTLTVGNESFDYFSLLALEAKGFPQVGRLPYSLKILLENLLRREDGSSVKPKDIEAVARGKESDAEISFMPARVLLQRASQNDRRCGGRCPRARAQSPG